MIGKIQKYQRPLLSGLIAICMGIMALGAVAYLERIKANLTSDAIQDVMDITLQQRQAFESFLSGDRERLHSYAEYFAGCESVTKENVQEQLEMFKNVDSVHAVICLEEGLFCSNAYPDIRQVDEEHMGVYRSLSGSGVRDDFLEIFSGRQMFGFYETFTFKNGHEGLIQKAYERSKVLETFTLLTFRAVKSGYPTSLTAPRNGKRRTILPMPCIWPRRPMMPKALSFPASVMISAPP